MSSWLIQAIVKGVLNWLKSLWDSFIQKQKHIEQGRQEVLEKLAEKERITDAELQKLRDADTSFDDAISELGMRADSRNDVSRN